MNKQDKPSREELVARAAQEDQTPDELLTPEQLKRKRDREKKRKQRTAERAAEKQLATESEQDWWNGNRALLQPKELSAMREQHERVLDQLHWMDHGHEVPADDPDFVNLEEGVADLVEFVKEHGVVHLGYITKNDIPADWCARQYWRDPELLEKLENENWQTARYVRYGVLAALPDWRVVEFLKDKSGWTWQQATDLVGYYRDERNIVRYR